MIEECREWNPIPDEYNRRHHLMMMQLEEPSTGDIPGPSLIAASYFPGEADNPELWKPGDGGSRLPCTVATACARFDAPATLR
jgi:hypothetical protein